MTPRLFLRDEAQADIEAAAQWYEERRVGLGFEFTRVVEVRRALVRRFPYAMYFVVEASAIVVIACLHVRRDPTVWQSRADI